MIPTELHLCLDFRSGGDPSCMSHWLKAYDAPHLLREGDLVNDTAAPEREELLAVTGTQYNVASSRLTAIVESPVPENLDEYLDRMKELAADGWHQLEDPFVYENPLPPVSGWEVEWRLRLHSTLPVPDGGTCWTKKTIEREAPAQRDHSREPVLMAGLIGQVVNAPVVEVVNTWRESGKPAAVAEVRLPLHDSNHELSKGEVEQLRQPIYGEQQVNAAVLLANGWKPLSSEVNRLISVKSEEPAHQ